MPMFRQRSFPVEAVQWNGDNINEVLALFGKHGTSAEIRVDGHVVEIVDDFSNRAARGDWLVYLEPCALVRFIGAAAFASAYEPQP
jgi:hypothetical protein